MQGRDAGVPPLAFVQLLNSQVLEDHDVAQFRSIMAREGADDAALVARDQPVPLDWFREVYPHLDADDATQLGFAFAEQAQLTSFGPLSLPLVSAGSVAEIVELLRYVPLISSALSPLFHPTEQGLTIGLTGHTSDVALDCMVVTYGGSVLLRLLDMLAGDVPTVTLHLSGPAPSSRTHHEQVLGDRLFFEAPTSFVHVPTDVLDEACRFADPVAYRLGIAELQRTLEQQIGASSLSDQVRRLLEHNRAETSSQSIAHQLSMSTSTLKRRLSDEGTTFRDLRQSYLREHTLLRLLDTSLSLTEIARDLGYGDLTNFSHAFKRWTGSSPSEFRRQRRPEAPVGNDTDT